MENQMTPPWAAELAEGEFISYSATYKVGEWFHLYEKKVYKSNASVGDITYYFYDPTKHGYPADKKYPLLVFLHGKSNALEGDICINYSGGELYASPDYQEKLGGAYVLIPLANEKRGEDGNVTGCWSKEYTEPVLALTKEFVKERENTIGKKFVFGNSRGAFFAFLVTETAPEFFDGCVPIGTSYIPEDASLDAFDANDVHLFLANSRHDEFMNFEEEVGPRIARLEAMKHAFLYFPKWTKNGDGGIASINFGVEMGQHCLVNSMHANLMFDDGTPMEESLPEGVIGWIKQVDRNKM